MRGNNEIFAIEPARLHNASAEACVLGCMIVDHTCIPGVLELIDAESFYLAEHKRMFAAILRVWRKNPGGAVDGVLLRAELENADELKDVGGLDYLAKVVNTVPFSHNARYYAGLVHERRRFRQLVAAVDEMSRTLTEGSDVGDQIRAVQELALGLEAASRRTTVYPMADYATKIAVDCQNDRDVLPTGFNAVDHYISGISPGELVIVAGRPSMGKSAFAACLALNAARKGKRVVYATLEMTAESLTTRLLAILSRVNAARVKNRIAGKEEMDRWYAAALELKELPITIVESLDRPEKQLAAVRREQKAVGVDVLVVDYLGLMRSGRRTSNRNEEVSEISRSLKLLAQDAHISVIALSQLNRQVTSREDHRPRLSDLRDSGSVEQDADVVLLLHREDYFRQQKSPDADLDGQAEVIVAKGRDSATGVAKMVFIAETTTFADLSWAEEVNTNFTVEN